MKNRSLLFILILVLSISACSKPDACINASATQVKLGQEILFTDCSVDGKSSKIDFGDGSEKKAIEGSISYAYSDAGTFSAKIEHYNKNEKKKDEAFVSIVVEAPTEAELLGAWRLHKEEQYSLGFSIMTAGSNELWAISSGSFTIDGGSSYTWSLGGNTLSSNHSDAPFSIAKLYNDELVLRYDEVDFFGIKTYSAYHFVKN